MFKFHLKLSMMTVLLSDTRHTWDENCQLSLSQHPEVPLYQLNRWKKKRNHLGQY